MDTYRRKPRKVCAVRYQEDASNASEVLEIIGNGLVTSCAAPTVPMQAILDGHYPQTYLLRGGYRLDPGDWLIVELDGQMSVEHDARFAEKYEEWDFEEAYHE